ncbi:MAG: hypothetical protein OQL18_11470 [Deltaproteobacteria bacterium]|nr:hypothetical protein [Deltaproteobacteria bacterium]
MKMIRSIVEFYSDKLGNGKCAFVVAGNISLLSAEFYGQSAKELHSEIKVFPSIAAAKEWVLN